MTLVNSLISLFCFVTSSKEHSDPSERRQQVVAGSEPLAKIGFNSLPDEVLLHMLGEIGSENQGCFYTLSITYRRLNHLATPYLYERPILGPANAALFERTLRNSRRIRCYIQKLSIMLFDADSKISIWNLKTLASHYRSIFEKCVNLESVEISRADTSESRWRSKTLEYLFKYSLSPLQKLSELKFIDCTSGRFPASLMRLPPNIETIRLACGPGDQWWKHWSRLSALQSLMIRHLEKDDIASFFEPLGDVGSPFKSVKVDLTAEEVTNVALKTSPTNATRSLTISLCKASWESTDSHDPAELIYKSVILICESINATKLHLQYSIPEDVRRGLEEVRAELKSLKECVASGLVVGDPKDVDEIVQRLNVAEDKISGIGRGLHRVMSTFAGVVGNRLGINVQLEFIDNSIGNGAT